MGEPAGLAIKLHAVGAGPFGGWDRSCMLPSVAIHPRHVRRDVPMRCVRALMTGLVLLSGLIGGPAGAAAQDRIRSKEVVIGLGAEPRTMLAVTIVDWTTN